MRKTKTFRKYWILLNAYRYISQINKIIALWNNIVSISGKLTIGPNLNDTKTKILYDDDNVKIIPWHVNSTNQISESNGDIDDREMWTATLTMTKVT